MSIDPVKRFRSWYRAALRDQVPLAEAMALATVDPQGRPAVRYVLLKSADDTGFTFFTNTGSRKGAELLANRKAALAFYWDGPGRQVRVEGDVKLVSEQEADDYWASRPRGSQIASAVSRQSARLANRAELIGRYRQLERELAGKPVPRPPHWTGFRLVPKRIEFWTRKEPRLHHRELFERTRAGWRHTLLEP